MEAKKETPEAGKGKKTVTFERGAQIRTLANVTATYAVENGGQVTFDTTTVSDEIMQQLLEYGIGRILPDRTSTLKDTAKANAMRELAAHFESGTIEWRLKVSPEERAKRALVEKVELVNAAFIRIYGAKAGSGAVAAYVAKKGVSEKAAADFLAGVGNVATAMAEIRAEREAAARKTTVESADELFGEMFD